MKRIYLQNFRSKNYDQKPRTSDRVEVELIKRIISLKLKPGSLIKEDELIRELRCGRTPLREALLRLSQANLVIDIPHKGMFVAEADLMNYVKLIEAIGLIESYTSILSVEQCNNDEIDSLEKILVKMQDAFNKKDYLAVVEMDFEFHLLISEFSRNDYILDITARLHRIISRYFYIGLTNGLDIETSLEEHRRIIKAFRRRNAEEVKNLMYFHMMEAKDRIAATMLNVGRSVFPKQINHQNDGPNQTIHIGVPTMMTGPGAPMGLEIIAGISMAVEAINQKGGVLGKKLEIIYSDIRDTNPEDTRMGLQLLSKANVVAFFPGGFYDPSCVVEFGAYNQPTLHASALIDTVEPIAANLKEFGNVFQVCASEEKLGPNAFNNMIALPYDYPNKKVAILGSDISYDMNMQKGIVHWAQKNGWEIVLNDSYPFGSLRFDSQMVRIRSEKPAIIFCCITSTESAIEFMAQFRQNPTNSLIFFHWSPVASKFLHELGDKANGIIWQTEFGYLPTQENLQWFKRFTTEFGREPGVAWPAMMEDMLNIWIQAVQACGDPHNYDDIIHFIRNLNQNPYQGRTGRFCINPERNEGLSGLDCLPIHTYQIQNKMNILLYLETVPFRGNDVIDEGRFMIPPWINT